MTDPIRRLHPSTSTNNSSLKGSEIITGGSIIIPIDSRTQATTISIIRNGIKIMKPTEKAVVTSLTIKAGISVVIGTSAGESGLLPSVIETISARSFSRVCLSIKDRSGVEVRSRAS
jgi:hypothetical protein